MSGDVAEVLQRNLEEAAGKVAVFVFAGVVLGIVGDRVG
jgi:hypothetical protein